MKRNIKGIIHADGFKNNIVIYICLIEIIKESHLGTIGIDNNLRGALLLPARFY